MQTDTPAVPEQLATPGFWRRIAAMFYDSLLVFAIAFTVTLGVVGLRTLFARDALNAGERAISGGYHYLLQVALLASIALFFCWFWTRSGQTLGMQTWRLRIDDVAGGRISWRQALIRLVVAAASALCFGLGYLSVLWDRNKCSWHDRASNSRVVLLPPSPKKSAQKKKPR